MQTRKTATCTIGVSVVLGLFSLLFSCTPFWGFWQHQDEPSSLSRGSAVVSHRGQVYIIGGKTPTGEYSDSVSMALRKEDGTLLSWSPQTPIPGARAFHSALAYGEYLYLIGGKDESGYLDEVWYTYLNPDGSLAPNWTKSPCSLPQGRAGAAAFIVYGRIYLAGGEVAIGVSDELLSSRIWRDGRPGIWTPVSKKLPSARSGAAALRRGERIYLAGGKSSAFFLSDFLVSELSATGTLGTWSAGPRLPDRRAFAALVPVGDTLAILGGEGSAGNQTKAYSLGASAAWERKPNLDGLDLEHAAVLHGYACLPPTAKPAGGLVNKDSSVALFAASDETIRYELAVGGTEPPDPDEHSVLYDPANRPKIGATAILKARSFTPGREASEVARLTFTVDSTSFVYTIGKTLYPASGYHDSVLQEIYSDGSKAPAKAVWYALAVADRGWYTLSIRDKDDDEAVYSDSVHLTLFEGSVLSLLADSADADIYKRQDDPTVYLAPGTYYLRIGSMSDAKGGSFGVRFSRDH